MRRRVDREDGAERRRDGGRRRGAGAGAKQGRELVEEGADVGEEELEEVLSWLFGREVWTRQENGKS